VSIVPRVYFTAIRKLTFTDQDSKATLYFAPSAEQVVIERNNVRTDSSQEFVAINDDVEVAPHTLFSTWDRGNNIVAHESLNIQLFVDASVLEVFVNERVAISTRIYADSGRCFAVRPFVQCTTGDGKRARLLQCKGWELEPAVIWM
jgi:beta-fructofuranosidase